MRSIYHITPLANLNAIVTYGGLCCERTNADLHLASVAIAHQHIKQRRAGKHVPVGPGGMLTDYVPFYFAPRSPMLYSLHKGRVEGYAGGQTPIVHLVVTIEDIVARGARFVFTDGHAVMDISSYFSDLRDLDKIDWEIMAAKYWSDTIEDGDRTRRRQAEFLVHQVLPWDWVAEIGVLNKAAAELVAGVMESARVRPPITVHRDWYY